MADQETAAHPLRERIIRCVRKLDDPPTTADVQPRPLVSDFDLTPGERPVPSAPLTPAAVLVPIVERSDGLTVLLTKRTDHLHDHAGQVSFPGGRTEEADEGPVRTALRETEEELGLGPSFIHVIGFLDAYETATGFLVTPVVGLVAPGFRLTPDRFEVAEVFEAQLSFLLDPANHQIKGRTVRGMRYGFYELAYGEYIIWGATAGMLVNLYRRVISKERPDRTPNPPR
uniref:8-oxo-dGTP pyrophosphatase MutT, NUDIX family n=1 Tax=Candidatus Kentrum eta TaxID=2126337 RepID=A0A450UPQ8_9GAMM|nr:MAG: 8-oxo-dGTP pyrophosphatase MutT, NUDIX family [Candidatus Kentron sp. H]VFJ94517.1 MAG: 8-oxo-dGTP pyrophosphatase MutT, NUDIX family [Candidatus Kentron sp. H]VFK01007.1 MAG: 8-oxo-dGTP pyrophosphatase MutT, NUDIX family [Candidatus Kentron sp. H]